MYRGNTLDGFLASINKTESCWLWAGKVGRSRALRYGIYCINLKAVRAHRFMYELHNGPIPDGLVVMHSCDNPLCVNPEHLSLGTTADNNRDKAEKGRTRRGEAHPDAKLTEEGVHSIRKEAAEGMGLRALADKYGVTKGAIYGILSGRTWKHITEEELVL